VERLLASREVIRGRRDELHPSGETKKWGSVLCFRFPAPVVSVNEMLRQLTAGSVLI
jgi:hypothetical protein